MKASPCITNEYIFSDSCSYLPWFEIYYKLLNTLADYLTKHQVIECILFYHCMCLEMSVFSVPRKRERKKKKPNPSPFIFFASVLWWDISFHCVLLVAFFVRVLFSVLGSTWFLLLAATMLTFHRPNAHLTLEVIPDDLVENKSLRENPHSIHSMHTNACSPLTIPCIVLAKGGEL